MPHMRKGEVGDWRNYFTVAQSEAFDELYQSRLASTGLEFEFKIATEGERRGSGRAESKI